MMKSSSIKDLNNNENEKLSKRKSDVSDATNVF